ncbi:MAG: DUF6290 family protein [Coriobacteriales bacterium]|nr:DUF6290 family protein [Coriobacteriales bacterium]
MSTTITLRLEEAEKGLIAEYAKMHGIGISEALREAMWEKIEDEIDLKAAEEAYAEYRRNPTTYSLEEVNAMWDA